MTQTKWEYSLTYFFIFVCGLLLLLIVLQFHFAENYQAKLKQDLKNVKSAGFEMQDIPNYQFSEKVLTDYNEMQERPLFFKDRRPIIPNETVDIYENVPEKIDITLIGIINTPDTVYSLFINPRAKLGESKFSRLKQGDEINGRTIKEIKYDRVLIESKYGADEILLAKPRPKKKARLAKKASKARKKTKLTKDKIKPKVNPIKRKPKK